MKKLISNIVAIGLLTSTLITPAYAAENYSISDSNDFEATFSPSRDYEDISGEKDHPGFGYPSYNNFFYDNTQEYNPADEGIEGVEGGSYFDERQFAWVAFAEKVGPEDYEFVLSDDGEILYTKGWMGLEGFNGFEDGDGLVFGIRFHNNGTDPYDGKGLLTPAEQVTAYKTRIGIDVSNPTRPVGFIYSEDNSYKNTLENTLNYENGDYIFFEDVDGAVGSTANTASDSVVIEPLPGQTITLELGEDPVAVVELGYDYDGDGTIETDYDNDGTVDTPNEWISYNVTTNEEGEEVEHITKLFSDV